jgi:hypothetical protein
MTESPFLTQKRKVMQYEHLSPYDDDNDKYRETPRVSNTNTILNEKMSSFNKKIIHLLQELKTFYNDCFNSYEETVRKLFFLMIFFFWIENLLISFTVIQSNLTSLGNIYRQNFYKFNISCSIFNYFI